MKIVVIGAGGRLGGALMREYRDRFEMLGLAHEQLDLGNAKKVEDWLKPLQFDVVVNTAAFTNVDRCEKEREQAFRVNAEAPGVVAKICSLKEAKLIHFSTDYVFDGEKREPYLEGDPARPISVYAESKREGEKVVLQTDERHLVVRVSWVFGPDRPSFVDMIINRARENDEIAAVADKLSTPTYTLDVARMLPQFFPGAGLAAGADPHREPGQKTAAGDSGYNGDIGYHDDYSGILHFANAGECSWQEYAQFALDCCRSVGIPLKARTVAAIKMADMKDWIARRPVYSVLGTEKFFSLTGKTPRNWRDAVGDYIKNYYPKQ
jgi:dTDP-4-dehydrorhamnose reductase